MKRITIVMSRSSYTSVNDYLPSPYGAAKSLLSEKHISCALPREKVFHPDFGGFTLAYISFSFKQIELGTACGKLFRCSTMAILDAGDSDILSDQQA